MARSFSTASARDLRAGRRSVEHAGGASAASPVDRRRWPPCDRRERAAFRRNRDARLLQPLDRSMRARVLGRRPSERAIAAVRALDDLVAQESLNQSSCARSTAASSCRLDPTVFALTHRTSTNCRVKPWRTSGARRSRVCGRRSTKPRSARTGSVLLPWRSRCSRCRQAVAVAGHRSRAPGRPRQAGRRRGADRRQNRHRRSSTCARRGCSTSSAGCSGRRRRSSLVVDLRGSRSSCGDSPTRVPGANRCGVPARDGR